MNILDDLLSELHDLTGTSPEVIILTLGGRKIPALIKDIPNNATVMATYKSSSYGYNPYSGRMAQQLTERYRSFMTYSCGKVHRMLEEDEYFRNSNFGSESRVLSDIADHYWRDGCKTCQPLCWKAADDEVMAQFPVDAKAKKKSTDGDSTISKQSIQTRIKRTSVKSIFRSRAEHQDAIRIVSGGWEDNIYSAAPQCTVLSQKFVRQMHGPTQTTRTQRTTHSSTRDNSANMRAFGTETSGNRMRGGELSERQRDLFLLRKRRVCGQRKLQVLLAARSAAFRRLSSDGRPPAATPHALGLVVHQF
ncbi:hypothetical protein EK21DRAFT_83403 [Setomelanomma holmii]|uniref:Uncharacterized protein n=1 Tax=Setomelanomma holmii TaxID=210430 RepID=A0A9P4HNG2_9PLEO|nr:hypothetical protein EK21DRAFT_83403 [Setomelanomma holmii]